MKFHEKLRELRKKRGMTQQELASSLYVSRTAVSKWESGRGYPEIGSLCAIARVFSVSVDSLLSEEETSPVRGRRASLWLGILNLGAALLLLLPLFAWRSAEAVLAVPLWRLEGISLYLCASAVTALLTVGGLTLALGQGRFLRWDRLKCKLSIAFWAASALLFAACLHPYAAAFALGILLAEGALLRRV